MYTVFYTARKANKSALNDFNCIILYVPGGCWIRTAMTSKWVTGILELHKDIQETQT